MISITYQSCFDIRKNKEINFKNEKNKKKLNTFIKWKN